MLKKRILSFVLCLLMIVTSSVCVTADEAALASGQIKNIIYMIPDGGAMAPFELAEAVKAAGGFDEAVYPNATELTSTEMYLREYLVGAETTYSANAEVTDSAAAGTALSSGYKTNNSYIGVDPDSVPRATILEASQEVGKNVGLVSTYEWMHATPAAFSAHETNRNNYAPMSEQIVNQGIDVVLGAGFGAAQWGNIGEAESRGYTIIDNREELEAVQTGDKIWGNLVTNNFPFDIYRDASIPNLPEMTRAAITALDGDSENGFFLMVEGSKVDGGGHSSNAVEMVSEFLAFDEAFKVALDYAKGRTDTLVVVLPDHDTGGITIASEDYATVVSEVQSGVNPSSITWEGNGGHTARNGGIFMYVPEGVAYPEGLNNTSADPFNENIVDNIVIAPYLADLIGVDLNTLSEELFVDVTNVGEYDPETEIFSFIDYDFSIKRNEAVAYYGEQEIDLGGRVAVYISGSFYVPQLLMDTIADLEGEIDLTVFDSILAATTTTENSFTIGTDGENTALEDIPNGTALTYGPKALGIASSNGLNLRMYIPSGTPENYTVKAYLVEDEAETLLGTYEAVLHRGNEYKNYFLPFDRKVTGDVTIKLVFGEGMETDVKVDFSTLSFINASLRTNAFLENYRTVQQFAGPDVWEMTDGSNLVYHYFGDNAGDYMIMPNVYFSDDTATAVTIRLDPPSDASRGELNQEAKMEVRLDGPTGEVVASLGYDDLNGMADGWQYVTMMLDKPLTGTHNICFRFTQFRSYFGSFRFLIPKDGTAAISADNYDALYGDVGKENNGVLSHFGQSDGEKLTYVLVDFGDSEMKALNVTFQAWNGDGDKLAGTDSRVEAYVDSISEENLLGTITYDDLTAHMDTEYTYTLRFDEPLTGIHDIIFVSYWQGRFYSFKFLEAKNGKERILGVDYDDSNPDISISASGDGVYDVVNHFGKIGATSKNPESLNYKLVDFGNEGVNKVYIRFRPWADSNNSPNQTSGRIEIYSDGEMVATVPYEDLNSSVDRTKTFSAELTETLTGMHDITITAYWQGGLSWIEFADGLLVSETTINTSAGSVSATLMGETDAETVQVVFVCYDADGRLAYSALAEPVSGADAANGTALSASFNASIPVGGTVKAYVWNSLDVMTPLANPVFLVI